MKNLKISQKFVATFGIILLLFTIVATFSIVSLQDVLGNFTQFYEQPYENISQVAEMRRAIQSSAKYVGYATMSVDLVQTQKHIDDCESELTVLKNGIEFLYKNFSGDMKLIDDFKFTINSSATTKDKVYNNAVSNNNVVAISTFFNEYQPYLIKANEQLLEIDRIAKLNADNLYITASKSSQSALVMAICFVLLTFILTVFLGLYISRCLKNPIAEIEGVAKQLAMGNLNVELNYESKDELGNLVYSMRSVIANIKLMIGDMTNCLGELAKGNFTVESTAEFMGDFLPLKNSINIIITSLNNTLGQINQSAEQVSSGSEQVSSGAQALSQGATEQASSIEELSTTITEISQQITQTAENAVQASNKVNDVGNEANESNRRMKEMLVAMNDISTSSSEIAKIIKTIEDIAFQTNILALNAAVEAARAGAAGKGFAVVADEVRNLASKSAEASKNTSTLIESSLKAVENGTKIADATAQSLGQVVTGVEDVTKTIDKISDAAREQAQAIVEITNGVDQISSVIQTNSATAQQSAATSEELSGQASMLKNLLEQFRLRNSNNLFMNSEDSNISQHKTSHQLDFFATSKSKY